MSCFLIYISCVFSQSLNHFEGRDEKLVDSYSQNFLIQTFYTCSRTQGKGGQKEKQLTLLKLMIQVQID